MRCLTALLGAALLTGCAALHTLPSDIATYGDWPAGRAPGSFAFDRLPSQQTTPEAIEQLEAAARPALEAAGFQAAPEGAEPDVLVQLAARSSPAADPLWADPFWWHGGFGVGRRGWPGPRWWGDVRFERGRYDREVVVLLRDRASGKPLYEAHASSEGSSPGYAGLNAALFRAALIDFPRTGPNPRQVTVTLP